MELQLAGRAGRQGDPGQSLMLYDFMDPLIAVYGTSGEGWYNGTAREGTVHRMRDRLPQKPHNSRPLFLLFRLRPGPADRSSGRRRLWLRVLSASAHAGRRPRQGARGYVPEAHREHEPDVQAGRECNSGVTV